MSEQSSFERLVADQLASAGMGKPPDSAVEDTISRAGDTRRDPRWLAMLKEPPMRTNSQLTVGSPTVRVAAVMLATLLLVVALAAVGVAGHRLLAADATIVVDQSGAGDYTTIAEAVAVAQDGNEILIKPGTYDESIDISAVGSDILFAMDHSIYAEDRGLLNDLGLLMLNGLHPPEMRMPTLRVVDGIGGRYWVMPV